MPRSRKKKITKRSLSSAEKRLRAVLGNEVLRTARDRFGKEKIDEAAREIAKRLDKKEQEKIRRERRLSKALSIADISPERFKVVKNIHRQQKGDYVFIKEKSGRYSRYLHGKRQAGTVTKKQKERAERLLPYKRLVRLVSGTLEIKKGEARRLISDVRKKSIAGLNRFKKSKKYKSFSRRRKRKFNQKNTSVTALVRLQYLLTGESDPVMFHFLS